MKGFLATLYIEVGLTASPALAEWGETLTGFVDLSDPNWVRLTPEQSDAPVATVHIPRARVVLMLEHPEDGAA